MTATPADPAPSHRHGPRRRLRRAVRAADRPPGARGARLQRDRARTRCRSPRCWPSGPAAIILSGGPSSVYADGAPSVDPALFDAGVPAFGICYGFQAMALALGGTVARTGLAEFGRTTLRGRRRRRRRCSTACPREQSVWMSHGDAVSEAPDGLRRRRAHDRRRAGRGVRGPRPRRWPACSSTPRCCTPSTARQVLEHFLYDVAGIAPDLDDGQRHRRAGRSDPRAGRRRAGHLRAVRRRRLRGRRGAGAPRGRRPAHLRVRRPRAAAQGRGRAGRARLRRRHRRPAQGRRRRRSGSSTRSPASPTPRRSARSSAASSSGSSRRPRARSSPRPGAHGETGRVPGAGHALPRRRRVRRRHRHREHQEPPQRRRPARRPAVRARRAAAHAVQGRGARGRPRARAARGDRLAAAVPRARASGSASSARSPRERLDVLREADAIAREELTAAGLDREIWQCPVVLLADVRSVGVQGDGRTYGHPVVLRPVSSEDAMTADWTRLPYDVLARISTRITNEVPRGQPGRARHHAQAARHHRVGVGRAGGSQRTGLRGVTMNRGTHHPDRPGTRRAPTDPQARARRRRHREPRPRGPRSALVRRVRARGAARTRAVPALRRRATNGR